jgi:hypothetical protein
MTPEVRRKGQAELVVLLLITLLALMIAIGGPAGCSRKFNSWTAESFGSNWLVIQYNQAGSPINIWELNNKSIGNELNSDGIYFVDNEGSVVHLSGHYMYIQVTSFDAARKKYLKE